ncbi:MAG: asparaginase [Betaproteobacteria bacterium]
MTTPMPTAEIAHVRIADVMRGGIVESVHRGSVAVCDANGTLLFAAGDPLSVTFTRSALKPLQALPFVAAGGVERFGYTSPEVALLCGSHAGETRHVEAAADMLAKAGNTAGNLQCGTHVPYRFDARGEVPPPPPYSPLANNCSGKHSGMLAYCVMCGHDKVDYLALEHPLQQAIKKAVSWYADVPETEMVAGIDGCSAPNYTLPLHRLAGAYARLGVGAVDANYGHAPRQIADAMTAHPEMISGEQGADLALSRAGRGDWISKIGAEGVRAMSIRSRGWGIAIKVADGHSRGLHAVTVAVLDQLGLLDKASRQALSPLASPVLRNWRGLVTGQIRAAVVLDKTNDHGFASATMSGK